MEESKSGMSWIGVLFVILVIWAIFGGGFGNGRFDILPAACASPEEDYRQRRKRAGEFTAGIGVDIHECHLPAAGGEQFHAGAPYAFGAPADKYTAFHEVKVTNKSRAKPNLFAFCRA